MRILTPLLMMLLVGALVTMTGVLSFRWLRLIAAGARALPFAITYIAGAFALLLLTAAFRPDARGVFGRIVPVIAFLLGVFIFVLLLSNLAALALLFVRAVTGTALTNTMKLTAGALVLTVSLGLAAYGTIHARQIRVQRYAVTVTASENTTLRIALISDLHLGYSVGEGAVSKIVGAVNEQSPDIVCIAGDIFDGDFRKIAYPEKIRELLLSVESKYGVYACLGNHDAGSTLGDMRAFLKSAGVTLLEDEAAEIDGRFLIAGRRDSFPIGGAGERTPVSYPRDDLPVILMDHQPGNISEYADGTPDLILCGHTHRGQFVPVSWITHAMYAADYGYLQMEEGPQVVVTSGAGVWGPPMRVGTNSEVAVIDVTFAVQ